MRCHYLGWKVVVLIWDPKRVNNQMWVAEKWPEASARFFGQVFSFANDGAIYASSNDPVTQMTFWRKLQWYGHVSRQSGLAKTMTGVFLSVPRYDWCAPLSHPCSCMLVNHRPSQQSSKEEYKAWKWGYTARYYTSHTKIILPTRKSVPRSSRQSDHTETSWPS